MLPAKTHALNVDHASINESQVSGILIKIIKRNSKMTHLLKKIQPNTNVIGVIQMVKIWQRYLDILFSLFFFLLQNIFLLKNEHITKKYYKQINGSAKLQTRNDEQSQIQFTTNIVRLFQLFNQVGFE
ncbi:Hypothetical_protein [Hexamita inflata]|uniref:Hypothetical_protein n=1 Tax=Hexamita inflata TaxID=28002 RepID=A0ABP1HMA8_9EUKA